MTAATRPVKPARTAASGWWTFLRLVGGWLTVAVLAYLLWMPSKDFGWTKMMFAWILLALLADEFAGWFGYIGLALGLLPFLYAGTPEQWFIIFPLIGGALFALLIMKHSGGPFVLPFGAALFMGAILAAAKFGVKLDPSLKLPASRSFQEAAALPMLAVVGFSFLRQLITMLVGWNARRKPSQAAPTSPPVSANTPVTSDPPASLPAASNAEVSQSNVPPLAAGEAGGDGAASPSPYSTIIDLDLDDPPTKT